MFEDSIINVNDISTVVPYWDNLSMGSEPPTGIRVTFMSKGTSIQLSGQTLKGFASLLSGAVF